MKKNGDEPAVQIEPQNHYERVGLDDWGKGEHRLSLDTES
jgi:hypothetical protein